MSREVELGWASWTSFASTELSKLFINSGATDIVLVILSSTAVERAIAQCTSRWAMARGQRLNTSIVLAAVYGLSGPFFGRFPRSSQSLSRPHPTLSPSLIGHPASVDVKQHESLGSHSSGAVWESRWTSWAVRPNEPSGFRGKDLLHRASALVTTCP